MPVGIRKSVQELYADYESGKDRKALENVIRAFRGIQDLPYTDPNSFFVLAGWHGEPFRGPGNDPNAESWWWGGYCNHGNVLFPTWHRAYCHRIEKALQSIPGCEEVMLPFWDECFEMDKPVGESPIVIPRILTEPKFKYDGDDKEFDNPLYSYVLAKNVNFQDPTPWSPKPQNTQYSKPKGYRTVRFPLSGLVGTPQDKKNTEVWNAKFSDPKENTRILNANVSNWLEGTLKLDPAPDGKPARLPDTFSVYAKFKLCLDAPNYTVFSNTTSASQWIADSTDPNNREGVVPLEAPHNSIHLAVGGFYQEGVYNANAPAYQQANGDMGENETASFDPIFFLHHCFIDYTFWCWQRRWSKTEHGNLNVIYDYAGTITDNNGSPVGLPPGSVLDMNTPLIPFRHQTDDRYLTSNDVTNIQDLDYTYGPGSLDKYIPQRKALLHLDPEENHDIASWKRVRGINRAAIEGSFVIRTYAYSPDKTRRVEIGREAVLSRLNVRGCKNCQTHLEADSFMPLYQGVVDHLTQGQQDKGNIEYRVELQTRKGVAAKVPMFVGGDPNKVEDHHPFVEDF